MVEENYGWVIAGAAFAVLFATYGVQYAFGVFVPAMAADLGWSRAVLGGVFSLYSVVYTVCTLGSGMLVDRGGPRGVIVVGGLLLGGGLVMSSAVREPWQLFLAFGIVAALGMSTAYVPCNMTVVRWFSARRGLALGVASSGSSIGIALVPLVVAALLAAYDWRVAMRVCGLVLLAVVVVAGLAMRRAPDDEMPAAAAVGDPGMSLASAWRTPAFRLMVTFFALTMMTIGVPYVHLASLVADRGLPGAMGAGAVTVIGSFSLVGALLLGAASDRFGRRPLLLFALGAQVVAMVSFALASSAPVLVLGALCFGLYYGGFVALYPALVAELFGPRHAGAIGGMVIALGGLLGGWGPALAGFIRDQRGDYALAFAAAAVLALLSAAVIVRLPRPLAAAGG